MSIYVLQDSGDILEAVRPEHGPLPIQKVLKAGELVNGIFNMDRSHFSVADNEGIFRGFPLDRNFDLLRMMCSLGDKTTEHVSSLITKFSLTNEKGEPITTEVGDGKYKSALFLYWLAEGKTNFGMDDVKRRMVWEYFGDDICYDALENEDTKHTTVRDLLRTSGCDVSIVRGNPVKVFGRMY